MNLIVDENVDKLVVESLRQDGHHVLYVAEFAPSIDDETVLEQANQNGALLITEDKDFDEIVFRQGRIHTGVVLIRFDGFVKTGESKNHLNYFSESRFPIAECFQCYLAWTS